MTDVDDITDKGPATEIDSSLPSLPLILTLDAIADERGFYPKTIRIDHGPELTSIAMLRWATEPDIETLLHRSRKPTQNGMAENFNARFRDKFLNEHVFVTLHEAREPRKFGASIQRSPPESNSSLPHASRVHA